MFKCRRSQWLGGLLKMYNSCPSLLKAERFICTAAATENVRVFTKHCLYKGKGAIAFHPGKPTFKATEDGAFAVDKEGCMFLDFTPSTGPRQYDWSQKQIMALSVEEMGSIIALNMSESAEFFHDPNLGSSAAGAVRKTLKVDPMNDKSGFFFTFDMANKQDNVDMHFTIPVTKGEFAVLRSSFSYIIPYLMGWHALANPSTALFGANARVHPSQEWSK